MTPEEKARPEIDAQLTACGLAVQDDKAVSVVGELESVLSANLQRASRLRQSILQKAFTGQLLIPHPAFRVPDGPPPPIHPPKAFTGELI